MALSYLWTMRALALDGVHDFSAGATTMTAINTAVLNSNGAMVGEKGALIAGSTDNFQCSPASIWSLTVGSWGCLWRYRMSGASVLVPQVFLVQGTATQNNIQGAISRSASTNKVELRFQVRRLGAGTKSMESVDADLQPGTIYGFVGRYDSVTTELMRIEIYNPFTRALLYSLDDATAFQGPSELDDTTGFRIGNWTTGAQQASIDNFMVSQVYAEPIQDYLWINSYTQYGVATPFTPSQIIVRPEKKLVVPPSLYVPDGGRMAMRDVRAWW